MYRLKENERFPLLNLSIKIIWKILQHIFDQKEMEDFQWLIINKITTSRKWRFLLMYTSIWRRWKIKNAECVYIINFSIRRRWMIFDVELIIREGLKHSKLWNCQSKRVAILTILKKSFRRRQKSLNIDCWSQEDERISKLNLSIRRRISLNDKQKETKILFLNCRSEGDTRTKQIKF